MTFALKQMTTNKKETTSLIHIYITNKKQVNLDKRYMKQNRNDYLGKTYRTYKNKQQSGKRNTCITNFTKLRLKLQTRTCITAKP